MINHVLLLVSDTFRYDFLGCTGNSFIDTTALDTFAKSCMVFDRCYTGSFPTIPHRSDLITGKFHFPYTGWARIEDQHITMADHLQHYGFANQLICDTPHLVGRGYNLMRGFHGYHWERGQEGDIPFTRMNDPIKPAMSHSKTRVDYLQHATPTHPTAIPHETALVDKHCWTNRHWRYEEDRFMARTANHVIRWMEDNYQANHLFLWMDMFDAHEPWDPPEYIVRKYDPHYTGDPMFHPNYGRADAYTPEELKNLQAHYSAEIQLVSKWIGRILEKCEELGLMEDSLIIFTSDHGIYLGEHDRTGKSNISVMDKRGAFPLYQELTHIPLFIYHPDMKAGRSNALVQPVDILPTILDCLGKSVPEDIDGKSLLPVIQGEADIHRDIVISAAAKLSDTHVVTVQNNQYTRVQFGPDEDQVELYDILSDSHQQHNLLPDQSNMEQELKQKLDAFMENHPSI
jgi:arylsulfatase A-like enzyme